MGETCETCRFGRFRPEVMFADLPGVVSRHAKVRCRRYPDERKKQPDDWCGEFSPLNPMEAGRETI